MANREMPIDRGVKRGSPSRNKVREWCKKYAVIRSQVLSKDAAYKRIAAEDEDPDRNWDYRTVRKYVARQLPLSTGDALEAVAELASFIESRLPIQGVVAHLEKVAPIEEVAPRLAKVAGQIIRENPRPDQGLRALAALLSGGFPLDRRGL
jgi:hypothetical protein